MLVTRMKPLLSFGAIVLALTLGCVRSSAKEPAETIVKVTAKKFEFSPETIKLKRGVAVTLELTSLDRKHGFIVPELGIRADVKPNETTRLHVVPNKIGTFAFHCDIFCGDGHEGMTGQIVVEP